MHNLTRRQKDVICVCIDCVQSVYNHAVSARITARDSHSSAHKNTLAVHKAPAYTPPSAQTPASKHPTYALLFQPFYRLAWVVILIFHRAYIYDQKLNIMKI